MMNITNDISNSGRKNEHAEIVKASQDFEAILIRSMLNENTKNSSETEAMKTFMEMQNAEMATGMSKSNGFGFSQFLIREWSKQ